MMLGSGAVMRVGCVAVLAVAAWCFVTAAPVRAQDDEGKVRAKAAFQAGVAAYGAGEYRDALGHFEEAQRLKPHPMVQVNIANCHDKLDQPVEAIAFYEKFLDAGQATAEQRKEVAEALKRLRGLVGRVLLTVSPDGASVSIDGGEARRAPIDEPLPLKTGPHRLEVRHDGYTAATREIDVKGGAVHEVDVKLEPSPVAAAPVLAPAPVPAEPHAAAAPAPAETVPPDTVAVSAPPAAAREPVQRDDSDSGGALPTRVWISGGVTVALIAGATITGVLALGAESEFEDKRQLRFSMDPNLPAGDRLAAYNAAVDAADRADALAIATDVLIGAALVGAGVTTYFVLTAEDEPAHAAVRPWLAHDRYGVGLDARF